MTQFSKSYILKYFIHLEILTFMQILVRKKELVPFFLILMSCSIILGEGAGNHDQEPICYSWDGKLLFALYWI